MNDEPLFRIVAIICLSVIVLAAIAGLTVVAVLTDRELRDPEAFTLVIALCVAALGGFSFVRVRKHRWRVEREDMNNGND